MIHSENIKAEQIAPRGSSGAIRVGMAIGIMIVSILAVIS